MGFGDRVLILKIMYNLWLDPWIPVQHPGRCLNILLEEKLLPQSSKVHLRAIWLLQRYFLSWLKSASLQFAPFTLYVLVNTPQLGGWAFYPDLSTFVSSRNWIFFACGIVTYSLSSPCVVGWFYGPKLKTLPSFGLHFPFRHIINNTHFYHSYLFSLLKSFKVLIQLSTLLHDLTVMPFLSQK